MKKTGWQKAWVRALTTLLTAALMVMIFCFSTENAEASDRRSGVLSLALIRVFQPDYEQMDAGEQQLVYDETQRVVRKCAHLTEYLLLGLVIRLCLESWFGHRTGRSRTLAGSSLVTGIFYACTDKMDPVTSYVESGNLQSILLNSGLNGNPQAMHQSF